MCGSGPHPGGALFKSLCRLADRFRACPDDVEAARIGSILSLLAMHASKRSEEDFRYELGSFLMDLALEDERRAAEPPVVDVVLAPCSTASTPRPVPYARAHLAR
ncbi:hypothetical protein [Chondromyces apiculatus]|nr:hypothetical protein [Chondromyces apiculatus]